MNTTSKEIEKIAHTAFEKYIYPAIVQNIPEIKDKFIVNITSSVAYGTADKYSDLDMFLIFYEQKDYIRYHKELTTLCSSIQYPDSYYTKFDKGIRIELESLSRADVKNIISHPEKEKNWLGLSGWLMYWFINSITIYDPKGLLTTARKYLSKYPDKIAEIKRLQIKEENTRIKVSLRKESIYSAFLTFDKIVRLLNAYIDYFFLEQSSFIPHPKWKYSIFEKECPKINVSRLNNIIDKLFEEEQLFEDDFAFVPCISTQPNSKIRSHETNSMTDIGNLSYDRFMRISNQEKWAQNEHISISDTLQKKVIKYYNFIIWRKIRVYEKSIKRQIRFVQLYYGLNICIDILTVLFMFNKKYMPPIESFQQQNIEEVLSILPENLKEEWSSLLSKKAMEWIIGKPDIFIDFTWKTYHVIQREWYQRKLITQKAIRDPLNTQFEIEYWKYENLFY